MSAIQSLLAVCFFSFIIHSLCAKQTEKKSKAPYPDMTTMIVTIRQDLEIPSKNIDGDLPSSTLQLFIEDLLVKFGCNATEVDSCNCLRGRTLELGVGWNNVSGSINEQQFGRATFVIAYFLMNASHPDQCPSMEQSILNPDSYYQKFLGDRKFDYSQRFEYRDILREKLEQLHERQIRPRDAEVASKIARKDEEEKKYFTKEERQENREIDRIMEEEKHTQNCFSIDDVFNNTGQLRANMDDSITKHEKELILALVLYNYKQGKVYCNLPDGIDFTDRLMENYEFDTGFTEIAFARMLRDLDVGSYHPEALLEAYSIRQMIKEEPKLSNVNALKKERKTRRLPREASYLNKSKEDEIIEHRLTKHELVKRSTREILEEIDEHVRLRRVRRELVRHQTKRDISKCASLPALMYIHDLKVGDQVTSDKMGNVCTTLMQQQLAKSCEYPPPVYEFKASKESQKYGYGFLSICILFVCSFLGIWMKYLKRLKVYAQLVNLMLGLSVGTLVCDSSIHLIPEVFGIDLPDKIHNLILSSTLDEGDSQLAFHDHLAKAIVIICGVYVVFAMQVLFGIFTFKKQPPNSELLTNEDSPSCKRPQWAETICDDEKMETEKKNVAMLEAQSSSICGDVGGSRSATKSGSQEDLNSPSSANGVYDDNQGNDIEETEVEEDEFTSICRYVAERLTSESMMIVLSEMLYCSAEGIAIGAAYAVSLKAGLSTTIAIFTQHIPHKLGGLMMLVESAGLGYNLALFMNCVASLPLFVGLFIGVTVTADETTRQWIFAVTSGMFMYIAMAVVIPRVVDNIARTLRRREKLLQFTVCSVGMLWGFVTIFFVQLFEKEILT